MFHVEQSGAWMRFYQIGVGKTMKDCAYYNDLGYIKGKQGINIVQYIIYKSYVAQFMLTFYLSKDREYAHSEAEKYALNAAFAHSEVEKNSLTDYETDVSYDELPRKYFERYLNGHIS